MKDEFSEYYNELLEGTYDCVDRIVVNAYCHLMQTAGGFRYWWNLFKGSIDQLDDAHLMRMAGRFGRRVCAWAKRKKVPIIYSKAKERKHEIAEQYLPADEEFTGVFLIIIARAAGVVWHVQRFGKRGFNLVKDIRFVNHYYFHIMDQEWGHIVIRICGHAPFGAMIIVNGHEWTQRQALKKELRVIKQENCFTESSDFTALDRVAESLYQNGAIGRLSRLCNRWIYSACLIFALDTDEQERTNFHYNYSIYQIEYSRNLIFQRGKYLDQIFQRLIDLTRGTFNIRTLTTIFGWKHRPCHVMNKGNGTRRFQATIERPMYNLTVFKLHYGNLTLKMYDKGERLLRIEAVAHNSKDLRCGRDIANFERMIIALKDMTIRFLKFVKYAHISFLSQESLDDLPKPTRRGEKRIAGIDLNNARIRSVIESLLSLAPKPNGFSVSELATKVRELTGFSEQQYSIRQASYDLNKFKAKGLIEKIIRSRRYIPNSEGFQTICALLILREKVIKPVLAAVGKSRLGRKPKKYSITDYHYENLRNELRSTLISLGIAA